MPFYLKHHFDPLVDEIRLKPQEQDDGSVDHYELNYIQNVEAGALLAEWVDPETVDSSEYNERFLFSEKRFPAGRGTGVKRREPDKLFAAVNGCVLYDNDKIIVKRNLTLLEDIDFRIGNIHYVGDLIIGGAVRTGFSVHANNISVQGQVEGAHIEALNDLNCRGGVKGGKSAMLEAGHSIKVSFCEFGTMKAGEDVMVKGSLMHSRVYAGKRLAVGGRLTGGDYFSHDYIYVGEQLGGGLGTDTSLVVGYDPVLLHADEEYNQRIKQLHKDIALYEKLLNKNDEHKEELTIKKDSAQKELSLLKKLKKKLWEGIRESENLDRCKILVTGVVKPGVEISIGSAFLKVDDFLEDVYFYYDNNEVKIGTTAKKL